MGRGAGSEEEAHRGGLGSIDVCGPSHLSPISFRLETNLQRRPIEGYLGSMEDGGLSQAGPLPNMHLKSCMEVGRPTLDSHKGPVVVGRPTVEDSFKARAYGGCREEICGCLNEADFGL